MTDFSRRCSGAPSLRLVHAKFGLAGSAVAARILTAEPAQLERWLERILTANSPDDLFK
jgi:hypothetical protein